MRCAGAKSNNVSVIQRMKAMVISCKKILQEHYKYNFKQIQMSVHAFENGTPNITDVTPKQ